MGNSIVKLLISRLIGFLVFLLLMLTLNILINYTTVPIFNEFITFLNNHLVFMSWIALLLVLGEIFILLKYPFNIPYPMFNSTGALLVVYFFADFFMFLMTYSQTQINFPFDTLFLIAGILVFFIVLIVGYYKIFTNIPEEWKIKRKVPEIQKPPQDIELEIHEHPTETKKTSKKKTNKTKAKTTKKKPTKKKSRSKKK